jgi:hypothetical protein
MKEISECKSLAEYYSQFPIFRIHKMLDSKYDRESFQDPINYWEIYTFEDGSVLKICDSFGTFVEH